MAAKSAEAPKKEKAKKGDVEATREERIDAMKAEVNKQFKGRGAVQSGNEFQNVFILRRPTGITSLDLEIGGGLPAGGLSQFVGKDGSTKSYTANMAIATCQRNYGKNSAIGLCMTELAYDKAFAKYKCGVRIAYSEDEIRRGELANGRPYTKEELAFLRDQIGFVEHAMFDTAELVLETAVKMVESNVFQIVLIDSFGALLTKAEAEAEEGLEQKHRGGASGVITQFMHRLHAALNMPDAYGRPNLTTVIGINQYRMNMGSDAQWRPLNQAGGFALKHGKLVDVFLEAATAQIVTYGTERVKVGKEIRWEVMKGKAGCHEGGKGSYQFYFGERGYGFGADIYEDLLSVAVLYGVVDQAGAWYNFKGDRLGNGKAAAARVLFEQPDLMAKIKEEIYVKKDLKILTQGDF